MKFLVCAMICAALGMGAAAEPVCMWLEAEGFKDTGGWAVDQQCMDQMGSPFLLAHGLGQPVADAVTEINVPQTGQYRLWVRTRDWANTQNSADAPGRFQVYVAGKPLETLFGAQGNQWHWQDGGVLNLTAGSLTVALHDLTGFEGRCDALVFSNTDTAPPNEKDALAAFRRTALKLPENPQEAGSFDLVVAGGGMAGTCAAITAARLGLKVALLQDRPVLGGNNSSEVRVHLNGGIHLPPYPALGNVVAELDSGKMGNAKPAENYADDQKLRIARAEKNLTLFLNHHVARAEITDARIQAVVAKDIRSGEERRFVAQSFADCTGDGTLGFLASAEFRMGREGRAETGESMAPETPDKRTLGASAQWYSVEDEPSSFPPCPWAIPFTETTCQRVMMGEWDWEVGMDRDQITDFESIRDHAFRAIYGNWAFLKNHPDTRDEFANRKLGWIAYIAGKRESRRLLGPVILQQQDIEEKRAFPDACVTTTWSIDLHYPQPKNADQFPGQEFRAICKQKEIAPYAIPYRCLYSRNVQNLFMAGRNISVTHVALGTVRVMRTGGLMGEVVGMAAAICKKHHTTPNGVYQDHLEKLKTLMSQGVPGPALSLE